MTKADSTRRTYDSTRRRAGATETRKRILAVAYKLFTQRGYAGVTMQAIADEAGVALQTVYAIFKNKPKVLTTLFNVSSAPAGEEHLPVVQRAGPQAVALEPDQRRQLQMFARIVADNLTGAAPISAIMADAARTEPDIDRILRRLNAGRIKHMTTAAEQIAAHGPFRDDMPLAHASDIIWALTSPELFLLLTRERAWSKETYATWLAGALIHELLP